MSKFTFSKPYTIPTVGTFKPGDTTDIDAAKADRLEAAGYGTKAKAGRPKKADEEG